MNIQQQKVVPNLEREEMFVNSLFAIVVYFALHKGDLDAATHKFAYLKPVLQRLAEQQIYYTLADDVVRLGDLLTALEYGDKQSAQTLLKKPFVFSGKLQYLPFPKTGEQEQLFVQLETMDKAYRPLLQYRNNRNLLHDEVQELVRNSTNPNNQKLIQLILSFADNNVNIVLKREEYTNLKTIPYPITDRILKKFLFREKQKQTSPPPQGKGDEQKPPTPPPKPQGKGAPGQKPPLPPPKPQGKGAPGQKPPSPPPPKPQRKGTPGQKPPSPPPPKPQGKGAPGQKSQTPPKPQRKGDEQKPPTPPKLQGKEDEQKDVIQLIKEALIKNSATIYRELQTQATKTNHWMWYAFPVDIQDVFKTVPNQQPSQTSKKYSVTPEDVRKFLNDNYLKNYYHNVLEIIVNRLKDNSLDLKKFFGDIDYHKFKFHINLFYKVCLEIQCSEMDNLTTIYNHIQQKEAQEEEQQRKRKAAQQKRKAEEEEKERKAKQETAKKAEEEKAEAARKAAQQAQAQETAKKAEEEKAEAARKAGQQAQAQEAAKKAEEEKAEAARRAGQQAQAQEAAKKAEEEKQAARKAGQQAQAQEAAKKAEEEKQAARKAGQQAQAQEAAKKAEEEKQAARRAAQRQEREKKRKAKQQAQALEQTFGVHQLFEEAQRTEQEQQRKAQEAAKKAEEEKAEAARRAAQRQEREKKRKAQEAKLKALKDEEERRLAARKKIAEANIKKAEADRIKEEQRKTRKAARDKKKLQAQKEQRQKNKTLLAIQTKKKDEYLKTLRTKQKEELRKKKQIQRKTAQRKKIQETKKEITDKLTEEDLKFYELKKFISKRLNFINAYNNRKYWAVENISPFLTPGTNVSVDKIIAMTNTLRDNHSSVRDRKSVFVDQDNRRKGYKTIEDLSTLLAYELDPKKFGSTERQKELRSSIGRLRQDSLFNNNFLSQKKKMIKSHFVNLAKYLFPMKQAATMTEPLITEDKSTSTIQLQQEQRQKRQQRRKREKEELERKQKEQQDARTLRQTESRRRVALLSHLNGQNVGGVSDALLDRILSDSGLYDKVIKFDRSMTMEQYNAEMTGLPRELDVLFRRKIEFEMARKQKDMKKNVLKIFLENLGVQPTDRDLERVIADDFLSDNVLSFDKSTTKEQEVDATLPDGIRNALKQLIQQRQQEKKRKQEQARILRQKEENQRIRKKQQNDRLKELEERKNKLTQKLRIMKLNIPSNLDALIVDEQVYNFLMNFDEEITTLAELNRHKTKLEEATFSSLKDAIEERMEQNKIAIDLETLDKYAKRITKYGYNYPNNKFDLEAYVKWIKKDILETTHFGSTKSFERDIPMFIQHAFMPVDLKEKWTGSNKSYATINLFKTSYTNSINRRLSQFVTDILDKLKKNERLPRMTMEKIRELWSNLPVLEKKR